MSGEWPNMDNVQEAVLAEAPAQQVVDEKVQLKALLAEARQTKEMLEDFKAALYMGTFQGGKMLAIAKGVSFLEAILNQNKAHIQNLQTRVGE